MILSKFTPWALRVAVIAFIFCILLPVFFIINFEEMYNNGQIVFFVFFELFFAYMCIQLIFGELRTKAIKVAITDNEIIKESFMGFGFKTKYSLDSFSGYKTSNVSSRADTYEYLYLIQGSRKAIKISEFYHKNYKDLKGTLMQRNIKRLGEERWTIFTEIKDIFR